MKGLIEGISPKTVRTDKIIVVRAGTIDTTADPSQDPDLKKLQEIPQFYPILRNSLNIPGLKDPPDLFTKFSSRPLLGLCQRLQEHYVITSEIVAAEQGSLGTRVREIDYAVATLSNFLTERQKTFAKFATEIQKIREINTQMKKISATFQETLPSIQTLNELLPEKERLPILDLSKFASSKEKGTDEQRVVDVDRKETVHTVNQ